MPVVQCPNPTNCLGVEEPVSNLSAEGPDIAKCFRYSFGPESQAVCEFNLSLCSAFAAVGADVGIFCDPPPQPGGPNPPVPVIYSSAAQTCTVDCGDSTSETYTVVSGTFVGLSQAIADDSAFTFACQLAAMQCTGPVTTFTNTPQTCTFTCPNGVVASYTTPVDFFTAFSQAEANLLAFLFACDVAALLCGGPPVGTFPGSGTQPQPPVDPVYTNSAQSCGSTCPDGSIFTYVINAGTYTAESRAAANTIARSAACSLANSFRVCLSNLPSGFCVNEFVFEAMDATGLASPVSFSVVSGALPDGLVLTPQGFLQGVPISPGSFTAVIRATGADGNFTQRSYTMATGEILPSVLDDANTSDPYSAALTADGFSGPVEWSIIAGSLPVPLELNPSTGTISGDAPETDGDFFFTIQAADGVLTCQKDYVLHVEGPSFCTNLVWGAPIITPSAPVAGTGSATASECTFHAEATAPAWPDSAAGNEVVEIGGSQFYTGPEINLNLHLIVSGISGNLGNSSLSIQLDGNPLVIISSNDLSANGTYDYPFTIPVSVSAQFVIQLTMIANGGDIFDPVAAAGVWDGVISLVP